MKDIDYAYACAYTRILENKLLNAADFEALLRAPSYEDAMRLLVEKEFEMGFASAWKEALASCPEGAPVHLLLYQNDFHNLKAILKAQFGGADYRPLMLEPYTVSPEVFHRAIANGRPGDLPAPFQAPAVEAYQTLAQEGNGQQAEIVLDNALLAALQETAAQDGDAYLVGWAQLLIDISQRKAAQRSAAEATQPIATLEKACDNEMIQYLRKARYQTFGFAPILGFCMGKKFELQAVRLILSGLRSGIPMQEIQERLRDSYA